MQTCSGKTISITYSECVFVALIMQHSVRIHRVFSSVAWPALQYYSTLSHKRHVFQKKKLLNTKCMFWVSLQLLSEVFLILRRNERDMIKNLYRFSCKVPFIFVGF